MLFLPTIPYITTVSVYKPYNGGCIRPLNIYNCNLCSINTAIWTFLKFSWVAMKSPTFSPFPGGLLFSSLIFLGNPRQWRWDWWIFYELTIIFEKKVFLSFFSDLQNGSEKIFFEYFFFFLTEKIYFFGWGRTVRTVRGRMDVVANYPYTLLTYIFEANYSSGKK